MATPVDLGYRHSGNAFGDHARHCRACAAGRHCDTRRAMLEDFERQERLREREARRRWHNDDAPTVEIPPVTMEQLVAGCGR